MEDIGIATLVLLITNSLVTYKGFKALAFFEEYAFKVEEIRFHKEYKRLVSSGFLHVNWLHFLFNMITLYLFSDSLEKTLGIPFFILIYFGSLVGGNLLALFVHRNHPSYRAVGASGAVSGLIFASIALFPEMELGFIFIPIHIPAWIFGIIYVAYSIYGIRSQHDNISHEAHLGGGLIGLIIAILLDTSILSTNLLTISLILIPSLIFLYVLIFISHLLLVTKPLSKPQGLLTFEDKYNAKKVNKQSEIDNLLDKINKIGYENLSKKDKERLKELNK